MAASETKYLEGILEEELTSARYATPDFELIMVVTAEGLLFAATDTLQEEWDQELIGGILSSAMGLGESVLGQLGKGELDTTYLGGTGGIVGIRRINEDYLLAILAKPNVKLGILFGQMKKLADSLRTKLVT